MSRARHIEVQIVGDGSGEVSRLWDRECSLQRQRQKLIEVAPAFGLSAGMRAEILDAARRLAAAAGYRGAGTMEFLVETDFHGREHFVFIEGCGQYDDLDLQLLLVQSAQHRQTIHSGHFKVQQQYVGLLLHNSLQSVVAIVAAGQNVNIRFGGN